MDTFDRWAGVGFKNGVMALWLLAAAWLVLLVVINKIDQGRFLVPTAWMVVLQVGLCVPWVAVQTIYCFRHPELLVDVGPLDDWRHLWWMVAIGELVLVWKMIPVCRADRAVYEFWMKKAANAERQVRELLAEGKSEEALDLRNRWLEWAKQQIGR